MAGAAAASATPSSCSALAGLKAPSPSWKDDHSPGCPAAFPGFAECLGTSGRGQVQGIKLTNGRAVCPGRRGIQAPTRRRLILAVGGPTERCPARLPGRKSGTVATSGWIRPGSLPQGRERGGGGCPSPTPGQAILAHPPVALAGAQFPCNCPSRSPLKTRTGPSHPHTVKCLPP